MQNQETPVYKWIDQIRKRPGMYIGELRLKGFEKMLEYLFEEILEDCSEDPVFEIEFSQENRLIISIANADTEKFLLRICNLQSSPDTVSSLGLGIFTALSSDILITVNTYPTLAVLIGQNGNFNIAATTSPKKEKKITIEYSADKEIFKDLELVYEQTNRFLRQFAFLNPGIKIISLDKTTDDLQRNIFHYPTGIFKQLDYFISGLAYSDVPLRIDIDAQMKNYTYKIGISYSYIWFNKSLVKTFAGNMETYLGGSLHDGIVEGLLSSIRKFAQKQNIEILVNRKLVKENLVVFAAVKGDEFNFAGSIKGKLSMPALKKEVKQLVCERLVEHLDLNSTAAEYILNKFKRQE